MNKLAVAVIIIILLVVYGVLALDYMEQGTEQDHLLSEMEEIKQSLQDVSGSPLNNLEELESVQATIAAEQEIIPDEIDSSDVIDAILNVAQMTGVKALPLATEPWTKERIGEGTYRVFRIHVGVEGTFAEVGDFINCLESGVLSTLLVEQLNISVADEEGEEYSGEDTPVVMEMDLVVLAQPLTN